MERWLVTGADGMLGRDLVGVLGRAGRPVVAAGRGTLDVTDPAAVDAALRRHRPAVLVNCAAWTAVEGAEAGEAAALRVNGTAVARLAAACTAAGVRLVHVSTDYVFDGTAGRPYAENDPPSPLNAYGRTKLAGERAALAVGGLVVRTAWLYGRHGPNFVRTIAAGERAGGLVEVVDDQYGQPTWTIDVADRIVALVAAGRSGVFHATGSGRTSWCGFAREIFRLLGADPARVCAVPTRRRPGAACRPRDTTLGHDSWTRAGLEPIGQWDRRLARALPDVLKGYMF